MHATRFVPYIVLLAMAGCSSAAGSDPPESDNQPGAGGCTSVSSASGTAVDDQGVPIPDLFAVLCVSMPGGSSTCLSPTRTNHAGAFEIALPEDKQCVTTAALQINSPSDLTRLPLYCEIDLRGGGNVALANPLKLPVAMPCDRDPLGEKTQPHGIRCPGSVTLSVVPADMWLFDVTYQDIRVAKWDASLGWPCFVDPAAPPDALFAFAPSVEVSSASAVQASFLNEYALAPGTTVDLYAVGGAASQRWDGSHVPEGAFEPIGTATVTADGTAIQTDDGLPFLTWVGYKVR